MITKTRVKRGDYYDSVTLLQVAQGLLKLRGCKDTAVVMGTPANKSILTDAQLLTSEAALAASDDLVIAVRAEEEVSADAALVEAERLLKTSRMAVQRSTGSEERPRTLTAAIEGMPGANITLVSVAGRYAGAVALEALQRGLHVFLFSDNVPIEEEIALKRLAVERGLLMMGRMPAQPSSTILRWASPTRFRKDRWASWPPPVRVFNPSAVLSDGMALGSLRPLVRVGAISRCLSVAS